MNRISTLAFALCAALVASSAWAQDNTASASSNPATTKNDDLRDLDLLVVTGATLDANTRRWADDVAAASASGQNNDVGTLGTIIVTGARLDADGQRWY
jgi:DNA/RNA endonuclease YhcR with UshA esterase domain